MRIYGHTGMAPNTRGNKSTFDHLCDCERGCRKHSAHGGYRKAANKAADRHILKRVARAEGKTACKVD